MSLFKTRQEIANEYDIDRKTFDTLLKKAGIILPPGNISPLDQDIIYKYFGPPKQ